MQKLLPFRQYDEQDVLGIFSLDVSSETAAKYVDLAPDNVNFGGGANWSGTLVKAVSTNALGGDEPLRTDDPYLGAIGSGDQGFAMQEGSFYPQAPLKVEAVTSAEDENSLGLTLRPTMAWDENMEKLLYYPVKKDEFQAVLPGETVPVVTRGFFTVKYGGTTTGVTISGTPTVGAILKSSTGAGELTTAGSAEKGIARVLAVGKNGGDNVALIQFGITATAS